MFSSTTKLGGLAALALSVAACSTAPPPNAEIAATTGSRAEGIILPNGEPLADPDARVAVPVDAIADRAGHGVLTYSGRNAIYARRNGPKLTGAWTVRGTRYCVTRSGQPEVCFTHYQTGANTFALWKLKPLWRYHERPAR